jgi:hypothetical protein
MVAYVGLAWLISLLAATFLGYDRGRWATGLLLGLFFGPIGVVAAGLMFPSVENTAMRNREVQRLVSHLTREERRDVRRRRKERDRFDEWVRDVESQVEGRNVNLADGMELLAHDIEALPEGTRLDEEKLRAWAGWLSERARAVRFAQASREERQ